MASSKSKGTKKTVLFALFLSISLSVSLVFKTLIKVALPSSEQPIVFYSNLTRQDLQATFVQAINGATDSISIVMYSFTDPTLTEALNKKAAEGVRVKVVYDAKASQFLPKYLDREIQAIKRKNQGLTHQKILVIDKESLWVGSANWTPQSLRYHANIVTAIWNRQLASWIDEKIDGLQQKGGTDFPHKAFTIHNQNLEFWFLPDDQEAVSKIKGLIRSAKKTVQVAMFTWTRQDFAEELIHAYKRGVDIEVVMDRSSSAGVSSKVRDLLISSGVPVFIYKGPGLLHCKMMLVDNRVFVSGSANWTNAAFNKNDDCFMILTDLQPNQQAFLDTFWYSLINDAAVREQTEEIL